MQLAEEKTINQPLQQATALIQCQPLRVIPKKSVDQINYYHYLLPSTFFTGKESERSQKSKDRIPDALETKIYSPPSSVRR